MGGERERERERERGKNTILISIIVDRHITNHPAPVGGVLGLNQIYYFKAKLHNSKSCLPTMLPSAYSILMRYWTISWQNRVMTLGLMLVFMTIYQRT